jgi:hypothetical protein
MPVQPRSCSLLQTDSPCDERERRAAVRCRCDLNSYCRRLGISNIGSWMGTAQDLSTKGVSLLLNGRISRGVFLDLSLERADGETFSKPLVVRVRRAIAQQDGTWLIGCTFVNRITKEDLHALLCDA